MGRYLGASIPTRLLIKKAKNSFTKIDVIKDQEKIIDKINEYIDLSFYYITYGEDYIYLRLNEKKTNEYLKELLKEINPIMGMDRYLFFNLYRDENTKEEFKFDNTHIKYIETEDDSNYFISGDNDKYMLKEVYTCLDGAPWLFDFKDEFYDLRTSMQAINIWINFEKFFSEDENVLLMLMNKFAKTYFKSKLSRIMIFNITE